MPFVGRCDWLLAAYCPEQRMCLPFYSVMLLLEVEVATDVSPDIFGSVSACLLLLPPSLRVAHSSTRACASAWCSHSTVSIYRYTVPGLVAYLHPCSCLEQFHGLHLQLSLRFCCGCLGQALLHPGKHLLDV